MGKTKATAKSLPGYGKTLAISRYTTDRYPTAVVDWVATPICLREKNMLGFINAITDKADWNKKVFSEEIVSKWRSEALDPEQLNLSEKCFSYVGHHCLQGRALKKKS